MVSVGRGKPKVVVNIEISKNGYLNERIAWHNVLHFGIYMKLDDFVEFPESSFGSQGSKNQARFRSQGIPKRMGSNSGHGPGIGRASTRASKFS
ncbi:hypothetical protein E2C01_043760 [Portunus trituberculatus]|uniref:Uncharacterized protein n=1 Tax=Portunus trituberculatus TaxID=210409 RepID=A0A5B7FX86_PORTR|nr:hypothetical protein [Portunus trituberculatus]